jgi:hypothetical protein
MACIIIYREPLSTTNPVEDLESYYLSGTGFVTAEISATLYDSKELAMPDAVIQREALGPGARLLVKDVISGSEWVVPDLVS